MPKIQTKLVMLPSPKMSMMMLPRRRRKQLIPINLKLMMLPSASQGTNDTSATGNINIILQSFTYRIDEGGIYLELLHKDVPSGSLEIVKDAEFKYKLQNVHFKEELFNTI